MQMLYSNKVIEKVGKSSSPSSSGIQCSSWSVEITDQILLHAIIVFFRKGERSVFFYENWKIVGLRWKMK